MYTWFVGDVSTLEKTPMSTTNAKPLPVYARPEDRLRLEHLCRLETRSMVDQLAVIIAEAFERRGLDPNTVLQSTPDGSPDNG